MLRSATIDKRGGFPSGLLDAALVVVPTETTDYGSYVIAEPARSLMNGVDIGQRFERLEDSFVLGEGLEIVVFKKTPPIDRHDLNMLSERLRQTYPDRSFIYRYIQAG